MLFPYKCFHDFYFRLGNLDAYAELNEVAIRFFEKKSQLAPDFKEFVLSSAKEYNIKVQFNSFPNLSTMAAKNYIVSVHEETYLFLNEYKDELFDILELNNKEDWSQSINGNKLVDTLNQLEMLGGFNTKLNTSTIQVQIFNYYHEMRNCLAHRGKKEKELRTEYQSICKNKENINKHFNIYNAPNEIDNVNIQDFYIFTRAVKEIASQLCNLLTPTPEQISKHIGYDKLKGLKQFTNNIKRQQQYVCGVAEPFFGTLGRDCVDAIISIINAH